MTKIYKLILLVSASIVINSCGGGGGGVSTMPTSDSFDDSSLNFNPKMDVLWVVDPSKSMYEEVEKVRSNIQAFISDFITNGYEYRIGVISTSAWSEEAYQDNTALTYLRDGSEPLFARLHKGECVDYPNVASNDPILSHLNTLNLGTFITRFQTNFDVYGVKLATSGCGLLGPPYGDYSPVTDNIFAESEYDLYRGAIADYINDERPLQSVRAFLNYDQTLPVNDRFVRDDAFLAVIIISDEQDASRDSFDPETTYNRSADPNRHSAQEYIDYITDNIKPSGQFAIYSIIDENISDNIAETAANLSGGVAFDINASSEEYVNNLNGIKDGILVSATAYPLACTAVVGSIEVEIIKLGGAIVDVPRDTGSGGWTYNSTAVTIEFSPAYLPVKGDLININYTPNTLNCGYGVNQPRLTLDNAEVLENTANSTLVGTVVLINADATDGIFSLEDDTSGGAFALDSSTGVITVVDNSKIDTETKSNEQVTVKLTLPDATEYDRVFTIKILDEADAEPVANDDSYIVSEATIDEAGNVNVIGNVSYNDTDLDPSEVHTFTKTSDPAQGSVSFNSDGSFIYQVNAASLALSAGDTSVQTFSYEVEDAASNSDTATVTITITGENQAPVLDLAIEDRTVTFDNTVMSVPFTTGDIAVSGVDSGSIADIIDAGLGTSFRTSSTGGAHFIEMQFPTANPFFEVQDFVINVPGSHSLGNSVLQVIAEDGRVLTREVLPVDENGSSLTIPLASQVIANKVKIIRPIGSMNLDGHQYLEVDRVQVRGIEAVVTSIDLNTHFSDPDGEVLTFYATDTFGEGPAPDWVWISGNELRFVPPPGTTNQAVGVLAQDPSGATSFTTFTITRSGSGSYVNKAPLSLLTLHDENRGGVSMMRFGGGVPPYTGVPETALVRHIEIDNFIFKPYITLGGGFYDIASDPEQTLHIAGDDYGGEVQDGWGQAPTHTDDKYPLSSYAYCNDTVFSGNYGKIIPCINANRSYGEIYSGYFVPAKTGVYKFRTKVIDNTIMLRMAPTEYLEDAMDVIIANWQDDALEDDLQSLAPGIGTAATSQSEFAGQGTGTSFTNYHALGYNTDLFFEMDNITQSRRDGYVHLRQGNVYAFEMRFGEGGGGVHFEFEYNYKTSSCDPTNSDMDNEGEGPCWDGWKALDASVVVPADGSNAYEPQIVGGLGGVSYNASQLFYDPESDALVYSARLVNADGTLYTLGASGTGQLSDIGLAISPQNGTLSGTLTNFTTHRPRIIFSATERDVVPAKSVDSLPIKIDETQVP